MTKRRIYTLAISSPAQQRGETTVQQQMASLGTIQSDIGSVDEIATEPGDETVEVQFRGDRSEMMVGQLDELATGSSIGPVAYFATSETTPSDGYYSLSRSRTGRVDPREPNISTFRGSLSHHGSRASHRRALSTAISQESHSFGNVQTALVGVPAVASKVRWLNEETEAVEEPTLVATRSSEHGDVEVYDARSSSHTNPTLIYDCSYADQGKTDPSVWDTRGNASRTDANDVMQWQKCFVSSHDFQGRAVISNGLVRLLIDESNQTLAAEEWDDSSSSWTSVSLGTSDWAFFDLDLRRVGLASVFATVEFVDTTQNPTSYYTLNMWVKRGWQWPLWSEPDGAGATPGGLVDLLDPIASESNYEPGEDLGLVGRGEF